MRIATADTTITFHDEVFGTQQYNLAHDIGDIIVRRSDGIYSYQLAVTVDDLDMGITDIVRGRDLLRSNALQIYIRKALITRDSSLPNRHSPSILPTVPINLTM